MAILLCMGAATLSAGLLLDILVLVCQVECDTKPNLLMRAALIDCWLVKEQFPGSSPGAAGKEAEQP